MAKKPTNAKASEADDAATAATVAGGTSAPVIDGGFGPATDDQVGTSDVGGAGALDNQAAAVAPMNSNPASSDASAGITGVEGSSASGTGDTAGSPVQASGWPWEGQPIPRFLDKEGKVRNLAAADVRPIPVTKNVKIDGVMLEAGTTPLIPRDVYAALVSLDAVEGDD